MIKLFIGLNAILLSFCVVMITIERKQQQDKIQQVHTTTIDIPKPHHDKIVMYTEETQWNRDNHIYTIETDSVIVVYRPKEVIDQLK